MSIALIQLDSVGSTQEAAAAAFAERRAPVAVRAGVQTAGRGRLGRTWMSPRGGLWLTIAWPLSQRKPVPPGISVVVGEVVRAALAEQLAPADRARLSIKWPNDVLLDERKIAGVLCEAKPVEQVLLIGIGVNANFPDTDLPDDARFPATTLQTALQHASDLDRLCEALLRELAEPLRLLDEPQRLEPWCARAAAALAWRDAPVTLQHVNGDAAAAGVVRGLDAIGGLILETAAGCASYYGGELSLRPQP